MKMKWLITLGLAATLVLGACGGSDESAETEGELIATPVATLAPADEATAEVTTEATAEVTAETTVEATEATVEATAEATEEATDEAAGTDAAASEAMTDTAGMTDTEGMTDTAGMTGTEGLDSTGGMTGTEMMTGSEELGASAAMTGVEAMTDTAEMTGTGAAAVAPAAAVTGTSGMTGTAGMAGTTNELQTDEQIETYGVVRASELMDFDVANLAGDDLADVDDAVVTLPDGCIQYVLVSSGGFLGLGEDQFLVPWRAVALNLEDGRLVLNVDQSLFDSAPIFDGNNVPDMNMQGWDADVRGFWDSVNVTPPVTDAGEGEIPAAVTEEMTDTAELGAMDAGTVMTDAAANAPGNMDATAESLEAQDDVLVRANPCDMSMTEMTGVSGMGDDAEMDATANMTDTAAGATGTAADETTIEVQTPQAVRLSELMDFGVKNSDGEDLGSLEDIVIDWQHSRLAYPIISFGGFLGLGDKWFVIPFDAVTLNPLDQTFIFDVEKEMLESAPGFDPDQLPDTTDPTWDADVRGYWNMGEGDGSDTGTSDMGTSDMGTGGTETVTSTATLTATETVTSTGD